MPMLKTQHVRSHLLTTHHAIRGQNANWRADAKTTTDGSSVFDDPFFIPSSSYLFYFLVAGARGFATTSIGLCTGAGLEIDWAPSSADWCASKRVSTLKRNCSSVTMTRDSK